MNLVKGTNTKYEEYESLLLDRDQIQKEAGQIWTAYIKEFGQLLTDVYEEKLECVKRKKTISYYQAALNHGDVVDPAAMQEYLDKELASYYANLRQMIQDNENCNNSGSSTYYEVQRSKILYRRIAKLIHPDINPETDRQDVLLELWQRTQTAYAHNDIKTLSEIEVLVRKAMKEIGLGEVKIDIPDIEEKITELKEEIRLITETEPYTYHILMNDPEAVRKKKTALSEELETYRNYRKELDTIIEDLLQNGGVKIRWQMN